MLAKPAMKSGTREAISGESGVRLKLLQRDGYRLSLGAVRKRTLMFESERHGLKRRHPF